jgi:hypothetical protein
VSSLHQLRMLSGAKTENNDQTSSYSGEEDL